MVCNKRCKNSKRDKKFCKCSCHGQNHAIRGNKRKEIKDDKLMSLEMGGEVAEFLKNYLDKELICMGVCHKKKIIDCLYGYEHEGGLKDKDNKGWWVFYCCDECGYCTSFNKIESRIYKSGNGV